MEIIDEYSSDSTVSYLSDSSFLFEQEDFYLIQKPYELNPKISSITSTLNLGCNLNLKIISQKIKTAEYNNDSKFSLTIKLKDNNSIAALYPNGKMICTGAKSEKEAKSNCIKFSKMIKKAGFYTNLKEFKITNISGNYDINFNLNLNKLYKEMNHLYESCKYDKNAFPGIILYINDINFTFFENGKIMFSGAKKKKDIEYIFNAIYPLLIEAKT